MIEANIHGCQPVTLVTIGFVQLLAVISPGPSFLITAQTAVARSRLDGVKVAFGLGAGTLVWSRRALLGLNALFRLHHWLFIGMKIARRAVPAVDRHADLPPCGATHRT